MKEYMADESNVYNDNQDDYDDEEEVDETAILKRLERVGMHEKESRIEHRSLPRASVLVPLFWSDKDATSSSSVLRMILTLRPQTLRNHAGEVCFPGGKQDFDLDGKDDVRTAMRETQEEIGLESQYIQPVCRLASLESYTGLCVTPIVAMIPNGSATVQQQRLSIQPDEVEVAFTVPVSYFYDDDNLTSKETIDWRGDTLEMRTYHYHCNETGRTFKIWGLTAYVAHQVAQLVLQQPPNRNSKIAFTTDTVQATVASPPPNILGSAYLYRRLLHGNTSNPVWSRKYFVVCTSQPQKMMLHQYDDDKQAVKKTHSANKKNRLPLVNVQIVQMMNADDDDEAIVTSSSSTNVVQQQKKQDQESPVSSSSLSKLVLYGFTIRVLQGRIEWHLAAENETERQRWIEILASSSS